MEHIKHKNGFSLVELSISLVVMGVIILGVMASLQSIAKNSAALKTEARLSKVSDTVANLAAGIMLLPTQATLNSSTAEQDAYGNDFNYFPAVNLTTATGTARICETDTTNLSIIIREAALPDKIIRNVAYVVSSNGANVTKDINSLSTSQVIINPATDDVYRYVSLYELKDRLNCPPPPELKIITKYLPPIVRLVPPTDKNLNIIFTSYGFEKDVRFCIRAANVNQASLINTNLRFRIFSNMSNVDTGTALPNITTNDCSTNAMYSNNARALRVEERAGANPGTHVFEVFAMDVVTGKKARASFVQVIASKF